MASSTNLDVQPTHVLRECAKRSNEILALLESGCSDRRRRMLLDDLIRVNLPVVRSIIGRYQRAGMEEGLEEVAYVALVRVAEAYDRSSDQDFISYAVPSILGELKRHRRDLDWTAGRARKS